ncbi:hypothetical protein [Tunturiibacter lichenicola]|jgi:hypothetical protein|uniref:hypothetical protein n=1 Tax=Tunturiibacter lichenicola TaxID=2051959 RepID=UPI003D9B1F0F
MSEKTIKTYAAWCQSQQPLTPFLSPGDAVDEAFVDWAMNVLPPARFDLGYVQIGEPHTEVSGRATFATFIHEFGR